MGRRPRSLVLGAVVVVAVLWSTAAAASQPAHPGVVRGAVDASGAPTAPAGPWHVDHTAPGTYRVRLADDGASLEVRRWDAVADVAVLPLGRGVNEVRFDVDGEPVDSAFAFVVLRHR